MFLILKNNIHLVTVLIIFGASFIYGIGRPKYLVGLFISLAASIISFSIVLTILLNIYSKKYYGREDFTALIDAVIAYGAASFVSILVFTGILVWYLYKQRSRPFIGKPSKIGMILTILSGVCIIFMIRNYFLCLQTSEQLAHTVATEYGSSACIEGYRELHSRGKAAVPGINAYLNKMGVAYREINKPGSDDITSNTCNSWDGVKCLLEFLKQHGATAECYSWIRNRLKPSEPEWLTKELITMVLSSNDPDSLNLLHNILEDRTRDMEPDYHNFLLLVITAFTDCKATANLTGDWRLKFLQNLEKLQTSCEEGEAASAAGKAIECLEQQ